MTRGEVIQLIREEMPQIIVNQLTSQGIKDDEVYLMNIEFGDAPKEVVHKVMNLLKLRLNEQGLMKFVLVPTHNGKYVTDVKIIKSSDLEQYENN